MTSLVMGRVEGVVYWILGENTRLLTRDRAVSKSSCFFELTFLCREKKIPKEKCIQ